MSLFVVVAVAVASGLYYSMPVQCQGLLSRCLARSQSTGSCFGAHCGQPLSQEHPLPPPQHSSPICPHIERQERLQLHGSAGLPPGVGGGIGAGLPLAFTAYIASAATPHVPCGGTPVPPGVARAIMM